LALEIAARNGQLEALQATLRLLTRELEEAIQKEAVAVAKLTLCQTKVCYLFVKKMRS